MLEGNATPCSHNILIKNLKDGENIKYSLLLIRGSVVPICNCENLIHLQACGEQKLTDSVCANTGEFKFILDLSKASSTNLQLNFEYCNTKTQIQLTLNAEISKYRLQPIYILCNDEEEIQLSRVHCKIIDLNLRLIQALYADRIVEAGLPRLTFTLNGDCYIYRSELKLCEALAVDEQTLWHRFAEELLRKNLFQTTLNDIGDCKLKIVAFIGCTKYDGVAVVASGDFSYANIKKHLKAHAALGGGDLALFGSQFFYAWPQSFEQIVPSLLNQQIIDPLYEADESNYRKTYGGVYSSSLGAVCHEIAHIFDLGHDDGIMGQGLDYVNRVLTKNKRTENLPKRIVGHVPTTTATFAHSNLKQQPIRGVTKFRSGNESFLENYREQKKHDAFYFTRNCALLLTHHRWFSGGGSFGNSSISENSDQLAAITFNLETLEVKSARAALKLIEIRSNADGKVRCFFELNDSSAYKFKIPKQKILQHQQTINDHHLFIMTINGLSKRIEIK